MHSDAAVRRAFGARVKDLREQAGLTQDQLAARLARTRDAVAAMESGRSSPHLPSMKRLADALNVSLPDLLDLGAAGTSDTRHRRATRRLIHLVRDEDAATIEFIARQARLTIRFARQVRAEAQPEEQ